MRCACRLLSSIARARAPTASLAGRQARQTAPRLHRDLAAAAAAASPSAPAARASAAPRKQHPSAAAMAPDSQGEAAAGGPGRRDQARRPKLWWKDRPSYRCPACGQCCFKVPNFETHILRCCPDVAAPEEWHALLHEATAAQPAGQPQDVQQPQQQAGGSQGQGEQPHWEVHPADAAIRRWLEGPVQQREAAARKRAVSCWRSCAALAGPPSVALHAAPKPSAAAAPFCRLQLEVAFHQRDAEGEPLKLGAAEVAQALGLPPARAELLLKVRPGGAVCR